MMTPERWLQVDQLFEAAMERDPSQRAAFLDQACAGDEALRREVESLLFAHEQAGSFIEASPADAAGELLEEVLEELPTGHKLNNYEIISLLGAGGMGSVYLAQDMRLGRKVALKVLPALFSKDSDRVSRFRREARAILALNHPNILTIYEVGEVEGVHFIATEFIQGPTLRQHLSQTTLELSQILDIAIQVAAALDAAHTEGIVHRDVKPENVMIGPGGYVKVLDFGLVKLTGQGISSIDGAATTITEPGRIMGTVNYMSPEQVRGLNVDARSDIWSLGCVIYELVAGSTPFKGSTCSDVIASILQKEPLPFAWHGREVPAELDRIVNKTLRKDREERYQVIKDLILDLKSLKHHLEFEAELERSASSEAVRSGAGAIAARRGRVTADEAATQVGRAAVMRKTSSVEYLVGEIKKRKRGAALILALLLAAVASITYYITTGKAAVSSVAVLPFVNASNDPNMEYISDGISDGLINSLSRLSQLKVIARYSTFQYKGKGVDLQEVARVLDVQTIVIGRVAQRGDLLNVSVELIDARDKTQMWGEQYNRKASDLQTLQQEIARTISEKLRLRLTGEQEQQMTKRPTENPEAYKLYMTGIYTGRKGGIENQKKAIDYFNQAIALDPNFALVYPSIAVLYTNLASSGVIDPKEAKLKATAAAQKALELDGNLAEAHGALAIIKNDDWDWSGADSEHKLAIELNPNLSGARANYAGYLSRMGRYTEALTEIKRARELDPLRINFMSSEGRILVWARRYDDAIEHLQNVIKMEPNFSLAHENLGYAYDAKGRYEEAIAEYKEVIRLDGDTPGMQTYLGYALAMSGKRDEALAILDKLKSTREHVSPAELAILYAGLGEKDEAFAALDRAYAEHDLQMQYLKVKPHYDSLLSDPRFTDLLRKVGFTP